MVRIPLGGDGLSAPIAAYAITDFEITGDASSGRADLRITMDPRFCSLVSYITMTNSQAATADADIRLTVGSDNPVAAVPLQVQAGNVESINGNVSGGITLNRTWTPPPFILPGGSVAPFARGQMLNVLNDVYGLRAMIFLFDIRVRELTPMGPLLWARGSL